MGKEVTDEAPRKVLEKYPGLNQQTNAKRVIIEIKDALRCLHGRLLSLPTTSQAQRRSQSTRQTNRKP